MNNRITAAIVGAALVIGFVLALIFGYQNTKSFRWEDGVCYRVTEQSVLGWNYSTVQTNALDTNCGDPDE